MPDSGGTGVFQCMFIREPCKHCSEPETLNIAIKNCNENGYILKNSQIWLKGLCIVIRFHLKWKLNLCNWMEKDIFHSNFKKFRRKQPFLTNVTMKRKLNSCKILQDVFLRSMEIPANRNCILYKSKKKNIVFILRNCNKLPWKHSY